jgi:hypothetical protein
MGLRLAERSTNYIITIRVKYEFSIGYRLMKTWEKLSRSGQIRYSAVIETDGIVEMVRTPTTPESFRP